MTKTVIQHSACAVLAYGSQISRSYVVSSAHVIAWVAETIVVPPMLKNPPKHESRKGGPRSVGIYIYIYTYIHIYIYMLGDYCFSGSAAVTISAGILEH